MQGAAEDARASLQAAQQERVALQGQQACLRADLDRLRGAREAAEQARSLAGWPCAVRQPLRPSSVLLHVPTP